jgi:hypothetical protein
MNLTICETRSLAELDTQIEDAPSAFVFLEVTVENLAAVIARLGSAIRSGGHCQVVALLESNLTEYCDLLREAGAIDVVRSPRELRHAVPLALLHTQVQRPMRCSGDDQSIEEWAMSLLPWQATR